MAGVERIGRYELIRHLASGGMARVFLARVRGVGGFERHVVLKTVRPERCEDAAYVTMFLDEARVVGALHHQNVAQVFEAGEADGAYFLAMEFIHGETVRSVLEQAGARGTRLPHAFGVTVTCGAAAGLHHAHERRGADGASLGIVHRDVSPSNVIAGHDGSVKLIDFGIAKAEARATTTQTGLVKGKAGYMAPEQALGYAVDRRSDVFALGVVLYELTTQQRAFRAASEFETVQRIVRGEVRPPTHVVPGYPPELEDVVMTALAVDPDDRFQDADAMRRALELTAAHLGIGLGADAVIRVLRELFGERPEPWLDDDLAADDATVVDEQGGSEPRRARPAAPATTASLPAIAAAGSPPPAAGGPPHRPSPPAIAISGELARAAAHDPDEVPTHRFILAEAAPPPPSAPVAPPRRTAAGSTPPPGIPIPLPPSTALTPPPTATPPPPPPRALATVVPLPPPPPRLAPPAFGIDTSSASIAPLVPSPRRWTWFAAVAAAVALATGVVAMLARRGDGVAPAPSALPVEGAPDPETPRAAPGPDPTPAAPDPAPVAPDPAPPPAPTPAPAAEVSPPRAAVPAGHVTVRVTSEPDDATVVLDNLRLGRTPLVTTVPAKRGRAHLKVRKRGHHPRSARVTLDRDVTWHATLPPR